MSFDVAADSYDRFMGRFSRPLAAALLDRLEPDVLAPGRRALDVGSGPGALTELLVARLGATAVAAADPSAPFVEAVGARLPGVDVRRAPAEALPWVDDAFDLVAASLVVHFMADPVAGLREMARVARPGGTVALTVWTFTPDAGPLGQFWAAVAEVDPGGPNERDLPVARPGELSRLVREAGLEPTDERPLTVEVPVGSLEEWWAPFAGGVGPAGERVAGLDPDRRTALRDRSAELLGARPGEPFTLACTAWCVVARA